MKILQQYLFIIIFLSLVSPVISQESPDQKNKRQLLLRDEGLSQLSYVDLGNPQNSWYTPVPAGRDLQLVGNGRVLVGTGTGYEEREIRTGNKVKEVTSFTGTISARRLSNGNTILVGLNWNDKKGIVLAEVDVSGKTQRIVNYPDFNYVRLIRETNKGTFLITADTVVFEGNTSGDILWHAKITSKKRPHAWQALRLANGNTVVASGYGGNFQIFDSEAKMISTISGPEEVNPNFYAGFQVLDNGNFVVANWQGHGPKFGSSGTQLLEYSPNGELVWSWKQDPVKFSSLQGVIVLDGLDLNRLHIENSEGKLAPVK